MNEKPEALVLADGLEQGIQLYLESLKNGDQQMTRLSSVAAELRRLHAENEARIATRDRQAAMLRRLEDREAELDAEIGHLRRENERLREALEKSLTDEQIRQIAASIDRSMPIEPAKILFARRIEAALRREEA